MKTALALFVILMINSCSTHAPKAPRIDDRKPVVKAKPVKPEMATATENKVVTGCPDEVKDLTFHIPLVAMHGASWTEGRGECRYTGKILPINYRADGLTQTPSVSCPDGERAYHHGDLVYFKGNEEVKTVRCHCTVYVKCENGKAIPVDFTW